MRLHRTRPHCAILCARLRVARRAHVFGGINFDALCCVLIVSSITTDALCCVLMISSTITDTLCCVLMISSITTDILCCVPQKLNFPEDWMFQVGTCNS